MQRCCLSDDVEFTQTVEANAPIRDCAKLLAVLMKELADRMQPVVHETASFAVYRRAHSATAVVPHHYDVLYLQYIDRELKHGEVVGILGRREVGDISMDEQFTRGEAHNLVGGHPAVGAADPQILRHLLALEPLEKLAIGRDHALRPGAVACFQVIQHVAPIMLI